MFEGHVLYFLRKYLGQYVRNIPEEALKISVWKGDVVLKDLELKAEALNELKLPVTVKAGFLGSVTLKVPWSRLGKEPVIVSLDRIYILAEPADHESLYEGDRGKEAQKKYKRRKIEDAEHMILELKDKKLGGKEPEGRSWIGSLISTIVGNLKITISNVHIRYEDPVSNPGHTFSVGITLQTVAAKTIDENGEETFATSGALEKLRKALQLSRLAIYHDTDTKRWEIGKEWKNLTAEEWGQIFQPGICNDGEVPERHYLLLPVGADMRYSREGKSDKRDKNIPSQKAGFVLNKVLFVVTEMQFENSVKLVEGIGTYRKKYEIAHLHPRTPVKGNAGLWWKFAFSSIAIQQKKVSRRRMSWGETYKVCQMRKKYVAQFSGLVESLPPGVTKVENVPEELRDIEVALPADVIILWRMLARSTVTRPKALDDKEPKIPESRGIFGWMRGQAVSDTQGEEAKSRLSQEEWQKLEELMSFQPTTDSLKIGPDDPPDMLQISVDVTMQQNTLRIIGNDGVDILSGSFGQLRVKTLMYPKTIKCDVDLASYGLSAPEGTLIQSVSEQTGALKLSYVLDPMEDDVDWKVQATVASSQVMMWRPSVDRFLNFLKSGQEASPELAMETAAMLQSTLEDVRRQAQEQLQLALLKRQRFSIDLDLEAPKITVPIDMDRSSQLVLDLGHFTLVTDQDKTVRRELDHEALYTKFNMSMSDISAMLVDGQFDWDLLPHLLNQGTKNGTVTEPAAAEPLPRCFPVLDKCGMTVILEQMMVVHPNYPSTRVAIRLPHMGFHFSPARYGRLMRVLRSAMPAKPEESSLLAAEAQADPLWLPGEHSSALWQLHWQGVASRTAMWEPRWAVVSGSYLYLMESETAKKQKATVRLAGKTILEIPAEDIGGSEYVVALCRKRMDTAQAVRSDQSVLLKFRSVHDKFEWLDRLTSAMYKSSAPALLPLLESDDKDTEAARLLRSPSLTAANQPLVHVTGALDHLQLNVSSKLSFGGDLDDESGLLCLRSSGGKVEILQKQHDFEMSIGVHKLELEDLFQGPLNSKARFMAVSLLSDRCEMDHSPTKPAEDAEQSDDEFFDAEEFTAMAELSPKAQSPLRGKSKSVLPSSDVLSLHDTDFVRLQIIMRQPTSPRYSDTDTQMIITMTTLEFGLNRPTVAALIELGGQLSRSTEDAPKLQLAATAAEEEKKAEVGGLKPAIVKGLLGQGKFRVVFQLEIHLERSKVILNLEDGTQLATLEQERISLDVKIFPASMRVFASMGNLRICNMLMGPDHQYGWFCDLRDPGSKSLVQIEMNSYNPDDDDYEGYEYSLDGKLSAVRISFLYRFVSELSAYFLALSSSTAQQAVVRVVDAVGGIERFIQQSEMAGSTGIRLNIEMEAPIIIMPRTSLSSDFMQIGLGHLQVTSVVEWRGGDKDDPSAVRVDVITVESREVDLRVAIDGKLREPMVKEMAGITVTVQRSLRDLFRKLPTMDVHVKIHKLRGEMSDKEYLLITECALENMAEQPQLPGPFQKPWMSETEEPVSSSSVQRAGAASQTTESYTTMRVVVDMQHAELELFNGFHRDTSLALLQIQGFWVQYCATNLSEREILVTFRKISLSDSRQGTLPEMQLALGSAVDAESAGQLQGSQIPLGFRSDSTQMTMITINVSSKPGSYAVSMRLQRPRLLVAMDFLLAFGEFFVPSIAAMAGKESDLDSRDDPVGTQKDIFITSAEHKQVEGTLYLSPEKQLLADWPGIDEYVYDGCGNTLCLLENENGVGVSGPMEEPLVVVGHGKTLHFKNVFVQNGTHFSEVIQLGIGSRFTAAAEDGVFLDGSGVPASYARNSDHLDSHFNDLLSEKPREASAAAATNYIIEMQAISPELTFYDSSKWVTTQLLKPEKLLRAKMDLNLALAMKGPDMRLSAAMKGLMVESSSGLAVLEPMDVSLDYSALEGKTSVSLSSTDMAVRVPINVVRLILRLSADLNSALTLGGGPVTARCRQFDRIWQAIPEEQETLMATFWRPRAPRGYAIVGDCVTAGTDPPSHAVMAVSLGYQRCTLPRDFTLLWSSASKDCCVWLPVPAPGYIAVGCCVTAGMQPPHKSTVRCVRRDLLCTTSFADCVFYDSAIEQKGQEFSGPSTIWRVDNAMGTFVACREISPPDTLLAMDLRDELKQTGLQDANSAESDPTSALPTAKSSKLSLSSSKRALTRTTTGRGSSRSMQPQQLPAAKPFVSTTKFERLWWDKGGDTSRHVSIWRPVPPPGYAILGDVAVEGFDPPDSSMTVLDDPKSSRLVKPLYFSERAFLSGRGWEGATVWYPEPPPGYISLGCILTKQMEAPSVDCIRCLRSDLANQKGFAGKAVWTWGPPRTGQVFSFWPVSNPCHSFIVHQDEKRPPWRMAFSLAELEHEDLPDNIEARVQTSRISLTVFDEFTGVMTPILDCSVTGFHMDCHGRREALKAVVLSSMAASTFNTQLGVWEPLVEPFDGIFKYSSSSGKNASDTAAESGGSSVEITTTSVVNVNVTSAGIDACAGASLSWRKTVELEAIAKQKLLSSEPLESKELTAVNREDGLRILVENQLGSAVYARTAQDGYQAVQELPSKKETAIPLPPLRFPELTRTASEDSVARKVRSFVAFRLIGAKGVEVGDSLNGCEFVCHLTLLLPTAEVQGQEAYQKVQQKARSRGVRPLSVGTNKQGTEVGTAEWNEVFLFEILNQGSATLELEIVNQAANSGRGVRVARSSCSLARKSGKSTWSVVKSGLGLGHSSANERELPLFSLLSESESETGTVTVASYSFTIGISGQLQTAEKVQTELETYQAMDTVLKLADSEKGPWSNMHSVTTLMTAPSAVNSRPLAMEMSMRYGLKCITLRSLAVLYNDTDVDLEVCVCPRNLLESDDSSVVERVEDCVFENQRYSPLLGWGSAWPGHLLPSDPARFSDADFGNSAQEIQVRCPPGWEYLDNWHVDRSVGDEEGWFYGKDFRSLKGAVSPISVQRKKGHFDFVRRRRMVRTREKQEGSLLLLPAVDRKKPRRLSVGKLSPKCSTPVPWDSLLIGSDWCLQLRPVPEAGQAVDWFGWSRVVPPPSEQRRSSNEGDKSRSLTSGSAFVLSELSVMKEGVKREELLECSTAKGAKFWLCVEADPTLLHSDDSAAVLDWRLTVQAPLKVENRLPVASEFILWEKTAGSAFGASLGSRTISRERGVVHAGEACYVYSVDIRCETSLTWLPQGGWKHEKDAVVVSDPWANDLPGHFWMVKTGSNRRVRVSIENDMGGSEVSARIIRLFVPYWLRNDTPLPLSCNLMEIEPQGAQDSDVGWLSIATRAAADSTRTLPRTASENNVSVAKKVVRRLEAIEDAVPNEPIMLSLPAVDNVGLAVAMNPDGMFSSAIALKSFEDKMERVGIRAVDLNGGVYMKLSVSLDLTSMGYERTKVVRLQPETVYTNRLGQKLFVRQSGGVVEKVLEPGDVRKPFLWESVWQREMLQVRLEGCHWSWPFKIESEVTLHVPMRNMQGQGRTFVRAEVMNGVNTSRFVVVFKLESSRPPYKIENRCAKAVMRVRQAGTMQEDWQSLQPGDSVPFSWPEINGQKLLEVSEVLEDGSPAESSVHVMIDRARDEDEATVTLSGAVSGTAFAVKVKMLEFSTALVKIEDSTLLESKPLPFSGSSSASSAMMEPGAVPAGVSSAEEQDLSGIESGDILFSFLLKLDDFGISLVDHTPEELLYVSMQSASVSYTTDTSGGSRLKVQLGHLQVDNQLAMTAIPVLLAPRENNSSRQDYVLRFNIVSKHDMDADVYPYIGLQLPSEAWLLNVHEPIIWRLQAMMKKLNLGQLSSSSSSDSTAVGVDAMVNIGFLNISECRLRLTLAMAPSQRPRGALNFWTNIVTSMGNTDEMLIRVKQKVREGVSIRRSQLLSAASSSLTNDLLSEPLLLISGLDVLGNASSALGHFSKGVADLSFDETFIRSRQKQEQQQSIEGIADGLREGGEALAKSLFRGVTGILMKPVEGAQQKGVEGFVTGVGKGLVGVAAQPVSGMLDLISKTTDGVNATRQKLAAAVISKAQLKRHRLPRAICGDNMLRPFDDTQAKGKVILQLAERGALFGTPGFDITERAKFAASDAYEEHFLLPGRKIAMLTNRRCILLQQPGGGVLGMGPKPDLLHDPCSIHWDVAWDELLTVQEKSAEGLLELHLRDWTQDSRLFDSRQIFRTIQANPNQLATLRAAIERAMEKYGPDRATVAAQTKRRRTESKPYAGAGAGAASALAIGLLALPTAPLSIPILAGVPLAIPLIAGVGAFVGGAGQVMLENDSQDLGSAWSGGYGKGTEKKGITPRSLSRSPAGPLQSSEVIRSFKLVWWDKGTSWSDKYSVSIWRPIPSPGFVSVGDVATTGYEQPEEVTVYRDNGDGMFAAALGFDLVWRDTDSGSKSPVTIWSPRAPTGYVGLGCVAVPDYYEPELGTMVCVRKENVSPSSLRGMVWRDRHKSALWRCSMWAVDNKAGTFLARRDHDKPPESQCFDVSLNKDV